jgi:uncharacterized protein YxjI
MYFKNFDKFIYDFNIDTTYTVTAGNFEIGKKYTIKTIDNTDFTKIGAKSNTVGVTFTATGAGFGKGEAYRTEKRLDYTVMRDITQNVRLRTEILGNVTLYDEYDIKEGETPEVIAEKVYGNPNYHWIVMLCNERYNYIDDFPLTQYELDKHITDKYGAGNEYATHHYVGATGQQSESSLSGITIVNPGTGYTSPPAITIIRNPIDDDTLGEYMPAVAIATVINGSLTKIELINAGRGYIHIPTVTVGPPPTTSSGVPGINATAIAGIITVGPVSNTDYEYAENEKKRRIKLISPQLLDTILKNYKDIM